MRRNKLNRVWKVHTTKREAGKGKKPRTGETIDIKACTTPKFKPGKKLKEFVNKYLIIWNTKIFCYKNKQLFIKYKERAKLKA